MESQADFRQYVKAVRKRWWLLGLLVIIAVTGAYYSFGNEPSSYVASATLMVTAPLVTVPAAGGPGSLRPLDPSSATVINDVKQLIRTQPIAERVARVLNISHSRRVQKALSASEVRGTDMIRIQASASSAEAAARMANAAAEELVGYLRETNSQGAREARRSVEVRLAEVRRQLEVSDRAILAARQSLPEAESAGSTIISVYYSALTSLDDARIALQQTDAHLQSATDRLRREQPTLVSETALLENPVFRQIQARLTELEIERTQLAQVYTPQHPRMQQLERQIAAMRQRLTSETATQVGREVRTTNPVHARLLQDIVTFQGERAATAARLAGLQQTVRTRRAAVAALPAAQLSVARLARENQVLEAAYRQLAQQQQDAILREDVARFFPTGLQMVEAAVAPDRPEPSSFPRAAGAAGLVGLILGIIAAILVETTDDGIRTSEDVERTLGVPVLAEVPNANQPRVAPANAMFMAGFVLLLGASLLGAYVRTPFAPVNTAGQVMRATVITPLQGGAERLSSWLQSIRQYQPQGAVIPGQ